MNRGSPMSFRTPAVSFPHPDESGEPDVVSDTCGVVSARLEPDVVSEINRGKTQKVCEQLEMF